LQLVTAHVSECIIFQVERVELAPDTFTLQPYIESGWGK
jgi:hypothetical protein